LKIIEKCLIFKAFRLSSKSSEAKTLKMAKDEARHGRALKGLLERYFK